MQTQNTNPPSLPPFLPSLAPALSIDLPTSFQLFQAADRFGVERLKKMCEHKMLTSLSLDNAAMILYTADVYHAAGLREKCLGFILQVRTRCFAFLASLPPSLSPSLLYLLCRRTMQP